MEGTIEQITELVRSKEVFGISIDTCIFTQHKNRLESGWFARLSQFKQSPQVLYISNIVKQEVIQHMVSEAESAKTAFRKAASAVCRNWNIEIDLCEFDLDSSLLMATTRFISFEELSGAKVVPISSDVTKVFDSYFQILPPFDKNDAKKYEFPDAFALQSLSELCESRKQKLIVVSADKGWVEFCKNSSSLICIENLGTALSCFQDQNATFAARLLSVAFEEYECPHLDRQIALKFETSLTRCSFDLDAESASFRLDYTLIRAEAVGFEVLDGHYGAFRAIEFVQDQLTVECCAEVDIVAEFELQFYVWDSEDAEEWSIASETRKASTSQIFDLLVTFDFPEFRDRIPEGVSVDSVEIRDRTIVFEMGTIEPSF